MSDSFGVKILMYHWVDWDPGQRLRNWGVTPEQFEAQIRQLSELDYQSVSLKQLMDILNRRRPAPPRGVVITFDDGYRDNFEQAWPILRRYGFSGTFFLVTDRVGKTNLWDAYHGDPPRPLMNWEEAAELARQGAEIGSHGRTHCFLPRLADSDLIREIQGSKEQLENRLGQSIHFFSYPYGLHDRRCLDLVADAGYLGACSDFRGSNRVGVNPFQLRRSLITCHDTAWSFGFKLRTGFSMKEWAVSKMGRWGRRLAPATSGVIP